MTDERIGEARLRSRLSGTSEGARAEMREGYLWSTPFSAAFFVGIIVTAFLLAELLALIIEFRAG